MCAQQDFFGHNLRIYARFFETQAKNIHEILKQCFQNNKMVKLLQIPSILRTK